MPRKPPEERKPARRGIDWDAVERDYRAGVLSNREIARQNSIAESAVRKRAKEENWSRDLIGKVRVEARAMLIRSAERSARAAEDEPVVIAKGAAQMVEVVRRHQRQMGKLADLAERMTDQMLRMSKGQKPTIAAPLGPRESIADALAKIAQATSRYVPLERRAHNIDEASAGEDLSSWLKAQSGLD